MFVCQNIVLATGEEPRAEGVEEAGAVAIVLTYLVTPYLEFEVIHAKRC